MIFGEVLVGEAEGAILAHSVSVQSVSGHISSLRKGHLLTRSDIETLHAAGVSRVTVARLEETDIGEDDAASRLANELEIAGVRIGPASTGRVNFFALEGGLFTVDPDVIDGINAVDPAVTIATLSDYDRVQSGQMVATVKIIPFAVDAGIIERIEKRISGRAAFGVLPFRPQRVGLIQTVLPSVKPSVLDKTKRIMEARIARNAGTVCGEMRVAHRMADLKEAIRQMQAACDTLIVFGASAVADPADIVPQAIREAGGTVHHIGMPVDPGNLLILGELDGKPVIGAPGCARSAKENGFDWVLDRLMAGVEVTPQDIVGMGVGGLLMEIPSRPQPRQAEPAARPVTVAIALLAAGQSRRMGGPNKLLARIDGEPIVRLSARRALASGGSPVIAVLGHMAGEIEAALSGLNVTTAINGAYAVGISSSIKAGLLHVPADADGMMVLLADMPALGPDHLKRLIDAFAKAGGSAVVRASFDGKRGNPVILPRSLFGAIERLTGDVGARHLIETGDTPVIDVEIGPAAMVDVDTPDDLQTAGGVIA
ncbi:4-diphosphocytidyl-2C-methyl-D-erythritol kinase [Paramesorhizobium deserti]|uniref:4-diphosphocytidyl-2C-methyl-D-erythritol kinase n=1 Tax=Paramesorhizobium deserti TaxID=1494590 RepID=A0A135HT79_9HYPH|nr:molybdopterin-binding/glycosyltransferase family 2 protein [Paramesorhizobium deserti]KXF76398.1 4-diphosphocytidyl-2C-methyl-D-erythritol kinase [Paramesorhizobium deserti]